MYRRLMLLTMLLMAVSLCLVCAGAETVSTGTWGTCDWSITNKILTVSEGQAGSVETAPWHADETAEGPQPAEYDTIIFKDGVVLEADASDLFSRCLEIKSIDLSGLDTSAVTNMSGMFDGCMNLASLDLSSFDTSHVTNMHNMFASCLALTELDLSMFDTSRVTDMSGMFMTDVFTPMKLASVDLSSFNTANVINMSNMFLGCAYLRSLDLAAFNTAKVRSMTCMFEGCARLESLDLRSFDTARVVRMDEMFASCSKLTSLDISTFDTSSVADMSGMFNACESMTELDLSHFDTRYVADMSRMFDSCMSLTALDISSFSTRQPADLTDFCLGCVRLATITFPSKNGVLHVSSLEQSFKDCYCLTALDLKCMDTSATTDASYMCANCYVLESADISKFDVRPITTMSGLFDTCISLESVNMPVYTEQTHRANLSRMFKNCMALTEIDVASLSGSDMSGMFEGCTALTRIDLNFIDTTQATDMSRMFKGCESLATIYMSDMVTPAVTDMSSMFEGCTSIQTIDARGFDTSNVEDMSRMFAGCTGLTVVELSSFKTSNVRRMDYMFRNCSKLSVISLSSFDTRNAESMTGFIATTSPLTVRVGNRFVLQSDGNSLWTSEKTHRTYTETEMRTSRKGISDTYQVITDLSGTWGTCTWSVTDDFEYMEVSAGTGGDAASAPWRFDAWRDILGEIHFEGTVELPQDCSELFSGIRADDVNFEMLDCAGVTSMRRFFEECTTVSADLSGWDVSSVTDMGGMFRNCDIGDLNVSGWNTSNVAYMDEIFMGAAIGETLDLSSWNNAAAAGEDMGLMATDTQILQFITGRGFTFRETSANVDEHYYSAAANRFFTGGEIIEGRSGVADTYTHRRCFDERLFGASIDEARTLKLPAALEQVESGAFTDTGALFIECTNPDTEFEEGSVSPGVAFVFTEDGTASEWAESHGYCTFYR